ncbi:MAG: glycosyltransferase [Proteobacteria bacterium]|nr:glycosyltransferase [Pseudomonadota bacterium]
MRILYYNWARYDCNNGGGVTVYQRNLINFLAARGEADVVFLSAGDVYSPFSGVPFIRRAPGSGSCRSYELVNSPVAAPAALLHNDLHSYMDTDNPGILDMVAGFIRGQGGFDVLHFNNLEGLPLNILKLKEYFPRMKIVFSLHNYFLFCPQVQLFQHQAGKSCDDYAGGKICLSCRYKEITPALMLDKLRRYFAEGSAWPTVLRPWLTIQARRLTEKILSVGKQKNQARDFAEFRRLNIDYINKYADCVVAVSNRVAEIAAAMGIDPVRCRVGYIGSDAAEDKPIRRKVPDNKMFSLIFAGYAKTDKGFYFMCEALCRLDESLRRRIRIVLAARKMETLDARRCVERLRACFYRVETYDGYRRDELPDLLKDVQLGIVPVLWEDNLPQVAIEFAAHGVPVLASEMGGASELSDSPYFRFRGGDYNDFTAKLAYIVRHPQILNDYWLHHRPPRTMHEHWAELSAVYAGA